MKETKLLVGVTGGIGSGKSTVCKIFEILGLPVYYSDDRAKTLMNSSNELRTSVKEILGEQAYKDGEINKPFVSRQIFESEDLRSQINLVVHQKVREDFAAWSIQSKSTILLNEAALIFENGSYRNMNYVINVNCNKELRIKRTLKRDQNRTRDEVIRIINTQWSDEERTAKADFNIANDETQMLMPQVLEIFSILTENGHSQ